MKKDGTAFLTFLVFKERFYIFRRFIMEENRKRMLSGIKPTGKLTLGNYIGALKQFITYQDEYEMYIFIIHHLFGFCKVNFVTYPSLNYVFWEAQPKMP